MTLTISLRANMLIVAVISGVSVISALIMEHVFGVPACHLCHLERIAYYVSTPTALAAFFLMGRFLLVSRVLFGGVALAFLANAGLGAYHAGVEWHWWAGPDACTGLQSLATSSQDLLKSLSEQKAVVPCDEAPFYIFGLSLAGYNALLSLAVAILAGLGAAGYALSVRLWTPWAWLARDNSDASV
ncbi:MAG: disulfide bond formation protein B [Alphaproteobacteria bacterium]